MKYKVSKGDYYEKERVVVAVTGVMDGEEKTVLVNLDNTQRTIDHLYFQRDEIDKQIAFNEERKTRILEATGTVKLKVAPVDEL